MSLMRAQILQEPMKFELKEVPIPSISDDEVLIKVKYCGICGSDWGSYTGKYAEEVALLPLTTGHEFCGTIEKLGKNAKNLKLGDRVACDICLPCNTCYQCRIGEPLLCTDFAQLGIHTTGAYAEYIKVPWKNIYLIPDEVSDEAAAFIEPMTCCLNASRKMDCQMGRSVVVIGCGLGIIHALMAKLRGAAPVIIVGDNAGRLEMAKKMGIDIGININEVADPAAEVFKLTGGLGADHVIEAVGVSATYEQAFKMLRKGGKLSSFGICSDDDFMKVPPMEFVLAEKKITGSCAGIGYDWADVITLLKFGRIDPTPMISMIVPLEELEPALKEMQENPKLVKVLVDPQAKERKILYK